MRTRWIESRRESENVHWVRPLDTFFCFLFLPDLIAIDLFSFVSTGDKCVKGEVITLCATPNRLPVPLSSGNTRQGKKKKRNDGGNQVLFLLRWGQLFRRKSDVGCDMSLSLIFLSSFYLSPFGKEKWGVDEWFFMFFLFSIIFPIPVVFSVNLPDPLNTDGFFVSFPLCAAEMSSSLAPVPMFETIGTAVLKI